jgi:hypothetical protein
VAEAVVSPTLIECQGTVWANAAELDDATMSAAMHARDRDDEPRWSRSCALRASTGTV